MIASDQDILEWAGKYMTKERHTYVAAVSARSKKSIVNDDGTHNDDHMTD